MLRIVLHKNSQIAELCLIGFSLPCRLCRCMLKLVYGCSNNAANVSSANNSAHCLHVVIFLHVWFYWIQFNVWIKLIIIVTYVDKPLYSFAKHRKPVPESQLLSSNCRPSVWTWRIGFFLIYLKFRASNFFLFFLSNVFHMSLSPKLCLQIAYFVKTIKNPKKWWKFTMTNGKSEYPISFGTVMFGIFVFFG